MGDVKIKGGAGVFLASFLGGVRVRLCSLFCWGWGGELAHKYFGVSFF